ncbi:citron Rho-interacting kinase isoform X2 [Nematostella vectensis]|uniref:citron Rho-interacting kinase isoform X2 n=1 Tax=Nematostella vectensis TaxID=45351 RepID=UPI0013901A97|nr:citron Rho-interacting kinase isoform X2 [Nematostella vectensis]
MMSESITTRCAKLNQLFVHKNGGRRSANVVSREALLDAFTVLFEECSSDHMKKKDKNIATFVKKYQPMINELRRLSLSKNDFNVVNTIGRGHFGEVQVVKDKATGDVYAMKTLKKSQTLSEEAVAFFEEEREIMATANNPWITSLQYAFQDSHSLYLVMDYHPGGDLLSLLSKYDDIFEEDMARFYLAEIVMAIHSLHTMGFVHRDVKPDNVLIDRTGHIKLADFGSSARLSADKKVFSKMPVGTPEYIAPEVLTSMDGSGGAYGVECDWWSLGVVAYEMLFGQTPFEADSVVVTYSKIMNFKSSLRFPSEPKISEDAKELIHNLLTSSEGRIGYEGLGCHKFFNGIEWNKLQNTLPPYVPTLDGTDDTSNFDEFEPDSDEMDQLKKYSFCSEEKGFKGKDLPFVGFSFIKNIPSPTSPRRRSSLVHSPIQHPGHLERKLTMKTNELKSALHSCNSLRNEKDGMTKMLGDLKRTLADKEQALRKAESERDLLEKEKVLHDSQVKDLQRRLDMERAERNKNDSNTLQMITELKHSSRKVEEMREQESRALMEDQQQIISELEQERFIANKRAHRLEEELRTQHLVNDESKKRINDLHTRIAKMNEEAKRSMGEWQAKLDKVTKESEDCISELESKLAQALKSRHEATTLLDDAREAKRDLEKELDTLKLQVEGTSSVTDGRKPSVRRSDSVMALKRREELAEEIVSRIRACSELMDKEESNLHEKYRDKAAELRKAQNKIMDLEDQLFKLQRSQKKLEKDASERRAAEDKLQEKEKDLSTLTRSKRQLESTIHRLQEQNSEKDQLIRHNEMRIKALQKRCQSESGSSEVDNGQTSPRAQDSAQLDEMRLEINSVQKELGCVQTELKEQQQANSTLEKKLRETEDKLAEMSSECAALQNTKKALEVTILKLENEIDEKLLRQELKAANLLAFDDLELKEKSEIVQELNRKLSEMSKNYENATMEGKRLECRIDELMDECSKVTAAKEKLEGELKERKRAQEGQDLTVSMLKSTCTMLESQVEELEIINEDFEEKQVKWEATRKSLELAREKAECSLAEAQRALEQEKATKSGLGEGVTKLQESLDSVHAVHTKEMAEKNEQLERLRQRTEELTSMLSEAEKKHGMAMLEVKSAERKLQLELEEKNKYKIESERLQGQIHNLKATNFELNQNIESVYEKVEGLHLERAALAEQLEVMETSYAEERLKLEATSAQQTKLIDFLQYKNEGACGKKRKLMGGGAKPWGKHAPSPGRNFVPKQWKDLQQALEKERASSLKLQTDLNRTKTELQAAKMEVAHWKSQCQSAGSGTPRPAQKFAVLSALQQSPSSQATPLTPQANNANKPPLPPDSSHRPKERMHHNIPHRFVNVLNMHPVKCAVCLDSVHFGRQSSKCAECDSVCHIKCCPNLPHTCGLPSQFVEHFSEALSDNMDVSLDKSMTRSISQHGLGLEGWMKVPSVIVNNAWEKKWLVLKEQKIMIFDKENVGDKTSPAETLHLDGRDGHVTVHSSVMSSELLGSAPTDLPYILRIESRPKCWPVQNLYLLAPSFKDKQKWVTALELTLDQIKKTSDKDGKKLLGNILLRLDGDEKVDINCTKLLNEELVLLGAEEGLYALSLTNPGKTKPREVPGIGKAFQIELVPEHNLAIMIAGKERVLCAVDLKQLTSRARQTNSSVPLKPLESHPIDKIKNCHLFAVGQCDGNQFICAATPNKLHLLRYNAGMGAYCSRKEVETCEPCNCIHFTSHSVVYGIGKFYSLDLRQHTVTEFLDPKDTSLAFAVYGAAQLNIFPIAVLDVTSPGAHSEEFLLCFNEFGVFVNGAGRQTREKTLMWTRLPLAVAYNAPFLFVTHFNSLDVCEIPPFSSPNANSFVHKFLEIQNPRVLGAAVSPGAVHIASTMQEHVEMLCFKGSSASSVASHSDEDLADFSEYTTERLRRISGATPSAPVPTVGGTPRKRRSASFRADGPFKTPNTKRKHCHEMNPR